MAFGLPPQRDHLPPQPPSFQPPAPSLEVFHQTCLEIQAPWFPLGAQASQGGKQARGLGSSSQHPHFGKSHPQGSWGLLPEAGWHNQGGLRRQERAGFKVAGLRTTLGWAWGAWGMAWVCFWLYARLIIWVFPKFQFLLHIFSASHPSVSHLH